MASLERGKEKEYIRRANAKAWEQYIRCRIDYHDPKYANISEEERQKIDRLNYCIWQECGGYGSPYWYDVFRNEDLEEEETIPPRNSFMNKIKDFFKGLRRHS